MNYSKWDNLDISSDEEDSAPKPRITKLDNASSITFGGGKTGIKGAPAIEINETKKNLPPPPPPSSSSSSSSSSIKVSKVSDKVLPSTATQKNNTTKVKGSLHESYSKWDKFVDSDDSDNDENDDEDDYDEEDNEAYEGEDMDAMDLDEEAREQAQLAKEMGAPTPEPKSQPGPKAKIDKLIDLNNSDILCRNGTNLLLHKYGYVWGQTRKEIMLYVAVPYNTKGKDIIIKATKWHLSIKLKNNKINHENDMNNDDNEQVITILDGRLAYPIDVPGEALNGAASEGDGKTVEIDWELKYGCKITTLPDESIIKKYENHGNGELRILCLTLIKKAPAPEVTVWWQNMITEHKGYNVSMDSMPDRATASQSLFQRNWNEAHIKFKEKVQNIEKTVVDTSPYESTESLTESPTESSTSSSVEEPEKIIEVSHDQSFDLDGN